MVGLFKAGEGEGTGDEEAGRRGRREGVVGVGGGDRGSSGGGEIGS